MTELDIIEAAIRRGFDIAMNSAYIEYQGRESWIEWEQAGEVLETAIEEMRKAASGQGAA